MYILIQGGLDRCDPGWWCSVRFDPSPPSPYIYVYWQPDERASPCCPLHMYFFLFLFGA